jgi:hypothetical protein
MMPLDRFRSAASLLNIHIKYCRANCQLRSARQYSTVSLITGLLAMSSVSIIEDSCVLGHWCRSEDASFGFAAAAGAQSS